MPQNAFFPRICNLLVSQKNDAKILFSTLHPLSLVIFATTTVLAFVLLRNSRFNCHCYTQSEATPTQKSAWKWLCDLLRLLAWKFTKGIHSCKPASLNRPIGMSLNHISCNTQYDYELWHNYILQHTIWQWCNNPMSRAVFDFESHILQNTISQSDSDWSWLITK